MFIIYVDLCMLPFLELFPLVIKQFCLDIVTWSFVIDRVYILTQIYAPHSCLYIFVDIICWVLSFLFFLFVWNIKKKKKEKLISNFNVSVKKNVFISVNKYTYIYILYIWNYIFFRCGRIFFMIYPYVYIYITWELRLADLSHTMLLRYGSLCFVCCIISVLDFIQY